ncbi:hypothetical protein [Mesorhizobium sp. B1-1-5]|uniref:hypothetical protein n=1 Tax=Mesorhizobium sp. B1-1-5 TaxID=2589979 RepID=UPI001129FCC3|nr:hypothetical protein [Mesorhizobium sp. B1-1-5]TPO13331.1 hypothetical protein FJ980_01105 [Mesorhizobium sp. B1-1-5]
MKRTTEFKGALVSIGYDARNGTFLSIAEVHQFLEVVEAKSNASDKAAAVAGKGAEVHRVRRKSAEVECMPDIGQASRNAGELQQTHYQEMMPTQ